MQSFGVNDGQYSYYFRPYIGNHKPSGFQSFKSFLKISFYIVISFIVLFFWTVILNYYRSYHPQIWNSQELYFVLDSGVILYFAMATSSILFMILQIYSIKQMIIIYLIVTASYLLWLIKHNSWVDTQVFTDSTSCGILNCYYYNTFTLIVTCIVPAVLPIVILIIYNIFQLFCGCMQSKEDRMKRLESNVIGVIELNVGLLDESQYESLNGRTSQQKDSASLLLRDQICINMVISIGYLSVFAFCWTWFFLFSDLNVQFAKQQFSMVVWTFTALNIICKLILKKLGRMIDGFRQNSFVERHRNIISRMNLEYLTEWIFGCFYWNWLRNWVALDARSWTEYLLFFSIHFISEIFESNVKFTKLYFNYSLRIQNYLQRKGINKYFCIFSHDKSDFDEWRNRISMDIMARFYCSLICGLITLTWYATYSPTVFADRYDNAQFDKSVSFLSVAIGSEIVHYLLTFYVVYQCGGFNITQPFIEYVESIGETKGDIIMITLIYHAWLIMIFIIS